jgi:hypothetical protein
MSQENGEIVRASVAVVIAASLVIVAILGVPWDDTTADPTADRVSEQDTLDEGPADETPVAVSEQDTVEVAPASKPCGDFPVPRPGQYPRIKVEVVEGNVPCRVAQRVIEDLYREVPRETGSWSCGGLTPGITECEKNRGRHQGTIRARL